MIRVFSFISDTFIDLTGSINNKIYALEDENGDKFKFIDLKVWTGSTYKALLIYEIIEGDE